ncbi:MAG: T9SS type A sorting domain-containing protein [Bacteroidetes bacterium]|nr:T9SS type A sorting domain-containing protein [Bacteroidota bacterium]
MLLSLLNFASLRIFVTSGSRVSISYTLSSIYPNPFNPTAQFELVISRDQNVSVKVYDVLGRHISTLHDGPMVANVSQQFELDARAWASGLYLVQIVGEQFSALRKSLLVK